MNLFFKRYRGRFFILVFLFIAFYCSNNKNNQYSIEKSNIQLLSITILKNTECGTNKQSSLIFFSIEKNQLDMCIYEIFFLSCQKWNNDILPDSCKNLNFQIK